MFGGLFIAVLNNGPLRRETPTRNTRRMGSVVVLAALIRKLRLDRDSLLASCRRSSDKGLAVGSRIGCALRRAHRAQDENPQTPQSSRRRKCSPNSI
jgi:hypothetical protein